MAHILPSKQPFVNGSAVNFRWCSNLHEMREKENNEQKWFVEHFPWSFLTFKCSIFTFSPPIFVEWLIIRLYCTYKDTAYHTRLSQYSVPSFETWLLNLFLHYQMILMAQFYCRICGRKIGRRRRGGGYRALNKWILIFTLCFLLSINQYEFWVGNTFI